MFVCVFALAHISVRQLRSRVFAFAIVLSFVFAFVFMCVFVFVLASMFVFVSVSVV